MGCVCPSGFQSVNTAHICSEPKRVFRRWAYIFEEIFFFFWNKKSWNSIVPSKSSTFRIFILYPSAFQGSYLENGMYSWWAVFDFT